MWKYMTRRFRDTIERSANVHFDKRGTTGVVNAGNLNEEKKRSGPPCSLLKTKKCWEYYRQGSKTNKNSWNFENLTSSWLSAITWSGALVISWYTSQLIQWKYKYYSRHHNDSSSTSLSCLLPYINLVNKNPAYLKPESSIEKLIGHFTPTVHLITNEQVGAQKEGIDSISSSSTTPDPTSNVLEDVLNSIENKLGLAAIENGQLQDGLKLLRSSASRSYAPALYNLGICYEMGLGVTTNEKMAMELYTSAATLEHPGALYNLGIYYGQGRGGIARDTVTATRLLRLAAVQGHQEAIEALKYLEVDIQDPPYNRSAGYPWSYNPEVSALSSTIPVPTTLFVKNVDYCPQKFETTVY